MRIDDGTTLGKLSENRTKKYTIDVIVGWFTTSSIRNLGANHAVILSPNRLTTC